VREDAAPARLPDREALDPDLMPWVEIELEPAGALVRATARGSRGQRPAPRSLGAELTRERLDLFAQKVGAAVGAGRALGAPLLVEAQALYDALFQGELRDVVTRLSESSSSGRLLIRLMIRDRALQGVPWEAACRPGTTEGFLGNSPKLLVARGVTSADAFVPRAVRGAVRVLAVAPSSQASALRGLEDALAGSIDAGEIAWLDPIVGDRASAPHFFDALRAGPAPHVLHFLGHGGLDARGRPSLRLADDEDGDEVWLTAESLAQELGASFGGDLRLVFLEACEGARAGELGSAAEILAQAGADAVVAHLWPVRVDAARAGSRAFYRALTAASRDRGDVVASLGAARRTLLMNGAEGLSPVLYLRAPGSTLFDFSERSVEPLDAPALPARQVRADVDPVLASLLRAPFSLVLGGLREHREAFQRELARFLADEPDLRRLTPAERVDRGALRHGPAALGAIVQRVLGAAEAQAAPPPLGAVARLLGPGAHAALLWSPHLERAVAEAQPQRTVHAVEAGLLGSARRPRVLTRPGGQKSFQMSATLPGPAELETDVVILRLDGGLSAEAPPVFSPAMLTEDDRDEALVGPDGFRPPGWASTILAALSSRPAFFVGISALSLQDRLILRWLFGDRRPPKGSGALLDRGGDPAEAEVWESGGCLAGSVGAIQMTPVELVAALSSFGPRGRS
jgi:hypothetical protein